MSLLDSGAVYQDVTVYPQELVTDIDGNPKTQPSADGIAAKARFQPMLQSGTSARIQESDNEGFESQEVYTMRFPRLSAENAPWEGYPTLGPQSELDWGFDSNGHPQRWAVFGFPARRNNSPATAHVTYLVKRY